MFTRKTAGDWDDYRAGFNTQDPVVARKADLADASIARRFAPGFLGVVGGLSGAALGSAGGRGALLGGGAGAALGLLGGYGIRHVAHSPYEGMGEEEGVEHMRQMMDAINRYKQGSAEAETLFKGAASLKSPKLTGMTRVGHGVGAAMDTFGGALGKAYAAIEPGYARGVREAAKDSGRVRKTFSGIGGALSQGASEFHDAGGTKPLLQGAGLAAAGLGGYKGLQYMFRPSEPQY